MVAGGHLVHAALPLLLHLLTPGLACSPQRCTITAANQTQASLQFSGQWVVDRELQAAVCPLNSSLSSMQPSTLLVTLTPVQEVVSSYPLWLCSTLNSDRATIHMAGVVSLHLGHQEATATYDFTLVEWRQPYPSYYRMFYWPREQDQQGILEPETRRGTPVVLLPRDGGDVLLLGGGPLTPCFPLIRTTGTDRSRTGGSMLEWWINTYAPLTEEMVGRAFTQLDTNGDLTVDAEELGASLDGPQGASQHLVDFLKHSALMKKRDQWSD